MDVVRECGEVSGRDRDGAVPANGEVAPEEIWKEPADRLLMRLATTPAGLGRAEPLFRLAIYGPNDAATVKRSPLWLQFLASSPDSATRWSLVASGLSAATGDVASFVIVVTIVRISMTLDFVQEVRLDVNRSRSPPHSSWTWRARHPPRCQSRSGLRCASSPPNVLRATHRFRDLLQVRSDGLRGGLRRRFRL